MRQLYILPIILCAGLALGQAAKPLGNCSPTELSDASKNARASFDALQYERRDDPDIGDKGQRMVLAAKDGIDAFLRASMNCASDSPDVAMLQREFTKALNKPGQDDSPEVTFDVRAMDSPRLIGVTATIPVPCGSDAALWLFAPNGNAWREVLRWQAAPYKTIDNAFWSFDYSVSPPDAQGRWYVVVKHVAPWCSSTWSGITYSALRPQPQGTAPKVLLSRHEYIWWGNEDFGSVQAEKDQFEVRYHSSSIDGGVHNRVFIRRYAIAGDQLQRVQPVAVSPRDFVDEWMVSSWSAARHWTLPAALARLKRQHEMELTVDGFDSIHRCSDRADHYEVAIEIARDKHVRREFVFYFHVLGEGPFMMADVSRRHDANCSGDDLLATIETK